MAELTTAQKLAEARQAYHEIITGQAVSRFVDQNGESVSYSKTNLGALAAYIAALEAGLASPGVTPYRGPIRFTFGRRGF
jgi:hypothetical protein